MSGDCVERAKRMHISMTVVILQRQSMIVAHINKSGDISESNKSAKSNKSGNGAERE